MRRSVDTVPAVISRHLRARCVFGCCWVLAAILAPPLAAQTLSPDDRTWLHIYVRDRQLTTAYEMAEQLLQQGRTAELVVQLQVIFEYPRDAFMLPATGELTSIRSRALQLIAQQPANVIREYRRIVGLDARQAFLKAASTREVVDYLRVVRFYFPTDSAYQSAEWLIKQWLDEGNWHGAAELAREFAESPLHQGHLTPRFLKMAIIANEFADRADIAAELRARLSKTAQNSPPVYSGISAAWLQPQDRPAKTNNTSTSPPILEPQWQAPLESSQTQVHVNQSLSEWTANQREHELSTAVGWLPVQASELILFRELDVIRAVHRETGATAWRYRTTSGLGNLLNPSGGDSSLRRHRPAMWDAAAANSLTCGLSTDGQRVFAVEGTDSLTLAGILGLESPHLPIMSRRDAVRNELIALDLRGVDGQAKLLWRTSSTPDNQRLSGHAFLGPPLAAGGILFAISEADREICVTSMDAATGRVLWQQPIAESERSLIEDRGRSLRACQPALFRDLVICPTNIGLLVAVDSVSGSLRWVHNSLEIPAESGIQRFRTLTPLVQRRHAGFPSTVLLADTQLYYLPSQSEGLYCLDATTGTERWKIAEIDAEYLAMADDQQVLAIGKSVVRALAQDDGRTLWTASLKGMVSGQGLPTQDGYLVPLENGQVVNLNRQTGRATGFRFDTQAHPVGHLLATDTMVVSVGAFGVTAFPQSQTVLNSLTKDTAAAKLPETLLKIAEVQLAQGRLPQAVAPLEASWHGLPAGPSKQQARHLLWETYFQLLQSGDAPDTDWLERLAPLLTTATPAEKVRWLVHASARSLHNSDWPAVIDQSLQLSEIPSSTSLIASPLDRDLEISHVTWLRQLGERLPVDNIRGEWEQQLLANAFQKTNLPTARAIAQILPPEVTLALLQPLSHQAIADGDWQQAAMLFSQISHFASKTSGDDSVQQLGRQAQLQLAELYAAAGFPELAASTLRASTSTSSEARRQWSHADSKVTSIALEETFAAWKRQSPIHGSIVRAQISGQPRRDTLVTDFLAPQATRPRQFAPYEDYQRPIGSVSPQSPLEWLLRNTERGTEIGVFDKLSSRKVMEVVLPFGASPAAATANLPHPLLMPVALPGEIRAISPLQGNSEFVAWSVRLPEWSARSGQVVSGPANLRIALYQWRNVLLAIDPTSGDLLWRRNDIEPNSGLYADSRIGLLSNEDVVFILAADKTSYRVLHAETGLVLRRGVLMQDTRFARYALGNCILHLSDEGDDRRIRLWDPHTDQLLLDDSLRSRQLFNRFDEDRVAWISADLHLKIYSGAERRIIADVALSTADLNGAATLKVVGIDGWHYVSIGRNQPMASTSHFHMPIPDKLIPGESVRDDLMAIGPEGHSIRWRKTIPQRSLLQIQAPDLPVLVLGCLVRDKRDPNRRWLRLEVLDRQTGHLVGVGDHQPNDRLLHAVYDGPNQTLQILGRTTEIQIQLQTVQEPAPVPLHPDFSAQPPL